MGKGRAWPAIVVLSANLERRTAAAQNKVLGRRRRRVVERDHHAVGVPNSVHRRAQNERKYSGDAREHLLLLLAGLGGKVEHQHARALLQNLVTNVLEQVLLQEAHGREEHRLRQILRVDIDEEGAGRATHSRIRTQVRNTLPQDQFDSLALLEPKPSLCSAHDGLVELDRSHRGRFARPAALPSEVRRKRPATEADDHRVAGAALGQELRCHHGLVELEGEVPMVDRRRRCIRCRIRLVDGVLALRLRLLALLGTFALALALALTNLLLLLVRLEQFGLRLHRVGVIKEHEATVGHEATRDIVLHAHFLHRQIPAQLGIDRRFHLARAQVRVHRQVRDGLVRFHKRRREREHGSGQLGLDGLH
mmetsp:Transcript_694/g.2110  ORF Transcript_694/g.2110 Transcript_694/m.2110 type:complete len:364 (+) Transcript_694:1875-2966(+)